LISVINLNLPKVSLDTLGKSDLEHLYTFAYASVFRQVCGFVAGALPSWGSRVLDFTFAVCVPRAYLGGLEAKNRLGLAMLDYIGERCARGSLGFILADFRNSGKLTDGKAK
jgi:hypothetical protein